MATENILMDAVKRGGDRQALHERIRTHALAAGQRVKGEGKDNDLLERIAADPAFGLSRQEVFRHLDPAAYIGCCPQPVSYTHLAGADLAVQHLRPVLPRAHQRGPGLQAQAHARGRPGEDASDPGEDHQRGVGRADLHYSVTR